MAKAGEVLELLCPGVEYTLIGQEFDDIDWLGKTAPITKTQYETGFAKVDELKAQENAAKATAKAALLEKLGISEDEARLLLA
ncbi:MAG: hypothetical protein KGR70_13485 [Cyanobacteria bacterium REEB494]|nr:hypothetical protein [Cyanobacteria bacterium REEB494]